MNELCQIALAVYDKFIWLRLSDVAVDCCITKAPYNGETAGNSQVVRGKQGIKRFRAVGSNDILLVSVVTPANRHDSPLLEDSRLA